METGTQLITTLLLPRRPSQEFGTDLWVKRDDVFGMAWQGGTKLEGSGTWLEQWSRKGQTQ